MRKNGLQSYAKVIGRSTYFAIQEFDKLSCYFFRWLHLKFKLTNSTISCSNNLLVAKMPTSHSFNSAAQLLAAAPSAATVITNNPFITEVTPPARGASRTPPPVSPPLLVELALPSAGGHHHHRRNVSDTSAFTDKQLLQSIDVGTLHQATSLVTTVTDSGGVSGSGQGMRSWNPFEDEDQVFGHEFDRIRKGSQSSKAKIGCN